MFEHRRKPLIPRRKYLKRLAANCGVALSVVLIALGIGTIGYHYAARLAWIDAFLNASMILTGMGPVHAIGSTGGKVSHRFTPCSAGSSS